MSASVYTFERWTLDCGRGALICETGDIALRPKSFEVLRFLIENAGQLVSRDEVLRAVWPGVIVTEESLTQCVSEVRQALGDAEQRIIKTVPKRGYLFAAAVNSERRDERDASAAPTTAPSQVATQTDAGSVPRAGGALDGPSVAVVPFANLSGDPSQEYLSDGITEDIINGLSYFSELSVIARNSSFTYKGRAFDVREVGARLGVRYVVEGSVRKFGDRIRITVQLVDAQTRVRRWAERFDRALGDIFAIQDEITQSIVGIVIAHLDKAEGERVSRKVPSSWTAYDLMMQGDQAFRVLEQSWDERHLYEARRFFEEAQKADPGSARICAKLAITYVRAHADPAVQECGNPIALRHGYELASKAVSLDPNLPYARAQLGWALFWMREPDAAMREFEKAIALNANFSDFHYPAVVIFSGAASRALDVLQTQMRLDPFHPPQLHAIQGHALYMLRRYGEAITPLSECIRRGPQVVLGQVWLAATLVRLGRRTEARAIAAEVLNRLPQFSLNRWTIFSLYRDPQDADHMIEALREAGYS